ncbi:MAG TPA: 2'-5' RNA ligase family protein [Trebonia sp.]
MTRVRDHWWWRPGWEPGRRFYTFHFTFEGQPAVQRLAATARERLAGSTALDLVPDKWLHLTTQGIGFADEISDSDLMAIRTAAQDRLLTVPPAEIIVGTPRAESEGIVCWIGPDCALNPAREALRAAIGDVWETDKIPESPEWTPHVSLAYANADADAAPYDAALQGISPVPVTVATVELIRLGRDRRVYEWEALASLPLGNSG